MYIQRYYRACVYANSFLRGLKSDLFNNNTKVHTCIIGVYVFFKYTLYYLSR